MRFLKPWGSKRAKTAKELVKPTMQELEVLREGPVGPIPGGSGFVARINNRSMTKTLETLEGIFRQAERVNDARAAHITSQVEVDRALRLLDGAEEIHEADADERYSVKAEAKLKRNTLEMQLMQSEEALKRARKEYGVSSTASGKTIEGEMVDVSPDTNEDTEEKEYENYRKAKDLIERFKDKTLDDEYRSLYDQAIANIRSYEEKHEIK